MRITFKEESLSNEYFAFVRDYWEKTPQNANSPKLMFNMDMYAKLHTGGALKLMVGRVADDVIIAAALYVIYPSPKHMPAIVAHCDTFAVSTGWRGRGLGTQLMAHALPMLESCGVDEVLQGYREVYGDTKPLFEKLGFAPYERLYRKELVRTPTPTRVRVCDEDENQLELPLLEGVV
jgi:GNAT superfamily N-acetyltransferase